MISVIFLAFLAENLAICRFPITVELAFAQRQKRI